MATPTRSLPARALRWLVAAIGVVLLLVLAGTFGRAWLAMPAAPLEAWHTEVPPELEPAQIDATDWAGYLAAEGKAFDGVRDRVTRRLAEGALDDLAIKSRYLEYRYGVPEALEDLTGGGGMPDTGVPLPDLSATPTKQGR
jgi:hypothetical protein